MSPLEFVRRAKAEVAQPAPETIEHRLIALAARHKGGANLIALAIVAAPFALRGWL